MRVVTDAGSIELGELETGATIGIVDYSRRVTDAFGVTTVVKRGFARRLSANLAVPFDDVDRVQQQLAELRATPATWIGDERFGSFQIRGLYKDFELNHAVPPLSFCALTIEGIAKEETFVDPGGDPALEGRSTLRLLDPIELGSAELVSSSVPETEAPTWSGGTTYPKGAQVILAATHRIYESLVDGNLGADPAGSGGKWLDIGPTNRWAMLDQALGTSTIRSGVIELVVKAGTAVTALALLDTNAASVRVRAPGYDRTQEPNRAGKVLFFDLVVAAGQSITITVTAASVTPGDRRWDDGALWLDAAVWQDSQAAGDGTVTIGTMLVGALRDLGVTAASPTSGITDYSRKTVDDFGEVMIVPRAYAKRMSAKAAIRTDAVDLVADRLAAVRAKPCLWLGDEGIDALTVYGFFKDFEISVDEAVSMLSLSIEGLSTAAPIKQGSLGSVAWPDVTDPAGTKPTDNADKTSENTSKDTAAVGGVPAASITGRLETLDTVTIPAIEAAGAAAGQRITEARAAADLALATIEDEVERVDQRIDNLSASGGYDDTAVNTRITDERDLSLGRDAALGTRIDTVTASIATTDTNLRALVTTKEQAAVDREHAISQRIDQILAEGGGGGDADTVARAEIQRVEQAAITRDTALASRSDLIEATAATMAGTLNSNPSFTIWPEGDQLPRRWAAWAAAPAIERRPVGSGLSGNVVRLSMDAAASSGLVDSPLPIAAGWYVIEADVQLITGRYEGAGLTIAGEVSLHFATEPDTAGLISATSTARRRFSKLVQLGGPREAWHLMLGWGGWVLIANIPAKVIDWYRAALRPATDAEIKAGKADAALPGITARIKTNEDTLADLPNRYATAQRATNIEASIGSAVGRIGSLERVTSDGTLVTAQRADNIEASLNDSRATVSQQAGAIVGLQGKAAAYVRLVADAGNGRAALSLWSDQYGGAWQLVGNGIISGDLTVDGSITARKFNGASMAREARSTWTGSITPAAGQTLTVPWTLTLPSIPPTGRFIYEATFVIETNEGQGFTQTINGYPAYAEYVSDGGSFFIGAFDNEGHPYLPRPNASDRVIATTDFAPTFVARVNRGMLDTGWIKDGDYYYRHIAATYTAKSIDLKATWVAI